MSRIHASSGEFEIRDVQQNDSAQKSKFDLGPRWSSEEINIFFESNSLCV